jgi:hypothetical protein
MSLSGSRGRGCLGMIVRLISKGRSKRGAYYYHGYYHGNPGSVSRALRTADLFEESGGPERRDHEKRFLTGP